MKPHDQLLQRIDDLVADAGLTRYVKLRRVCHWLHEAFDNYDWVGFYLDEPQSEILLLGPFVGEPTEHCRIPHGRGICGQVAVSRKTFVSDDVTREENYIPCSAEVRSEIVVPILVDGEFVAQLDIDSNTAAAFTPADREFLEAVCQRLATLFT